DLPVLAARLTDPGRYPVVGNGVHRSCPDQHVDGSAADKDDRVQRTVHVVLRHADVVAEPVVDRVPAAVQHAERDVAVALGPVDDDHDPRGVGGAQPFDARVGAGDPAAPRQTAVNGVQVPGTGLDLGPDAGRGQFGAHSVDQHAQVGAPAFLRLPDEGRYAVVRL